MIPRSILKPIYRMHNRITMLISGVIVLIIISLSLVAYIIISKINPPPSTVLINTTPEKVTSTKVVEPRYKMPGIQRMYNELLESKKLIGEGVYVVAWDKSSNKFYDMYGKNIDSPFNAASVTKLMTLLTLADGDMLTSDMVTGEEGRQLLPEGEMSGDFRGQTFSQPDLVAAMLIQSSNQAAYSLAKPVGLDTFIDNMNKEARRIGMSRTVLRDPSGYDFGQKNKASYMSPRDVARVAFKLVNEYPDIVKLSSHNNFDITNTKGRKFTLRNTNPLVEKTDNVILSKTGYTNLAGGNLAMVTEPRPGVTVAYVTMHSTKDGRFSDMDTLVSNMNTVFDMYDALTKSLQE